MLGLVGRHRSGGVSASRFGRLAACRLMLPTVVAMRRCGPVAPPPRLLPRPYCGSAVVLLLIVPPPAGSALGLTWCSSGRFAGARCSVRPA
eukprot:5088088-Alexandrium_andersonii.AAC.1